MTHRSLASNIQDPACTRPSDIRAEERSCRQMPLSTFSMPRKQVYGKRSRVIPDTFAIFAGSPEKSQEKEPIEIINVVEVAEELATLRLQNTSNPNNGRIALGQRDANSVVQSPLVTRKGHRRRPRSGRLITEEDELEFDGGDRIKGLSIEDGLDHDDQGSQENHEPEPEPAYEHDEAPAPTVLLEGSSEKRNASIHDQELATLASTPEEIVPEPLSELQPVTKSAEPDAYSQHCQQLLPMSAHGLEDFSSWAAELAEHFDLLKIAEASFGEVYRLSLSSHTSSLSLSRNDESVLKIIALKPPTETMPKEKRKRNAALKKAEAMSAPADVASEVRLLQRMSSIPGFTNFRDVRILKGRPPPPFVKAFKEYNANQKTAGKEASIFPDPARKTSYAADQLWAVIEMQDAGTDLERLVENGDCSSVFAVWDVLWQVVLSLAKGEEGAQFEHRDLHLGNICVRGSGANQEPDVTRRLGFTQLETTLIDYTISRANMATTLSTDSTATSTAGTPEIAYTDLTTHAEIFEGDATEEYQYEIYRHMRSTLFLNHPLEDHDTHWRKVKKAIASGTSWQSYCPATNSVWLHFVLFKLLEGVEWPSAVSGAKKKRMGKHDKKRLERAKQLEDVLVRVQGLLDPEVDVVLGGASELVALALAEGWLGVEDVVGSGRGEPLDEVESGGEEELVEALGGLKVEKDHTKGA